VDLSMNQVPVCLLPDPLTPTGVVGLVAVERQHVPNPSVRMGCVPLDQLQQEQIARLKVPLLVLRE